MRGYAVYSDKDINFFAKEYFGKSNMGRMTAVLKPVADRYNNLNSDECYQFRRLCRNMIKWYGYISQVVRMFDKDLHEEYTFLSYLSRLIPAESAQKIDLEGKLKLEFYKLQKTFKGAIELEKESAAYIPATAKSSAKPEEEKLLDEIIRKINEQYKGKFTEADKVLLTTLTAKLMNNDKLKTRAKTGDPKIFAESIFPRAFDTVAHESYIESQDAYATLFEDQAKYNAIMHALVSILYREIRFT